MDVERAKINEKLERFTTPKTFLNLITTTISPDRVTTTTERTTGPIDSMREQLRTAGVHSTTLRTATTTRRKKPLMPSRFRKRPTSPPRKYA